jgi:hypothetical protein
MQYNNSCPPNGRQPPMVGSVLMRPVVTIMVKAETHAVVVASSVIQMVVSAIIVSTVDSRPATLRVII